MGVIRTAHENARALVVGEIVGEARRQLATHGAATLSVRAVARELGMASSAVYRYVSSKDELLTLLIVDAYDALGETAEAAGASASGDVLARFRTVCRAVRGWALEHPHEYALIYGSPVPGYHAPSSTLEPASRVTRLLIGLLLEAHQEGRLGPARVALDPASTIRDMHRLIEGSGLSIPPATIAAGLIAWALLFGQISFEIFGRLTDLVPDAEALFEHAVTTMADLVGMTPS